MRLAMGMLCAAVLLAGCTTTAKRDAALATKDAVFLADQIAGYVGDRLPAASTTVWLTVPAPLKGQPPLALNTEVPVALRSRGFAVAEGEQAAASEHRIAWSAVGLDDGVVVKVTLDGHEAARWYSRDPAGLLEPASAFTVRVSP